MFIPPYCISLSGGGIKGFAHVGVLEVLHERGYLSHVREYIGISAGALCAMCMCIGCSISELRMVISLLDFELVRDVAPETILDFPETFGLDTGVNLRKLISAMLRAKGLPPSITFSELHAKGLGKNLRVIATNMNTCMPHEFSYKLTPTTEILFAIQASMSIPLYFTPPRDVVTGHYFVDGGVLCSSPFYYLTDEERVHTLAVSFDDSHKTTNEITSLSRFMIQLYHSTDYKHSSELMAQWPRNTIIVKCGFVNVLEFEADFEKKRDLFEAGRRGAEKFLKTPGPPPVRRFSLT